MILGITTPHADPQFPSAVPGEVRAKAGKRIQDIPWLSPGAVNAEAGGNGYYKPDLTAYRRLADRAADRVKSQSSKLVLLDMEDVPLEPGHTGESAAHVLRGAPTWERWRQPGGKQQCIYGWRYMSGPAAAVAATAGVNVSIYGGLGAWVGRPPPQNFEEANDYREMRAVEDSFLKPHVGSACVDVYPWWSDTPLADWEVDFERRLRRAPSGKGRFPLLYFRWQHGPDANRYVGDDLAAAMIDGCRRRGFAFVGVFEPPEEVWPVLLKAVA